MFAEAIVSCYRISRRAAGSQAIIPTGRYSKGRVIRAPVRDDRLCFCTLIIVQTIHEISSARSLHYSLSPTSFVLTIPAVMTSLPSTASTSISLRPATPRDIPALTEIYNHEIIHTSSLFNYDPVTEADRLKWLETTQAGGYPVLVAVYRDDGERTVGFCSLGALIAKAGYRKYVARMRLQAEIIMDMVIMTWFTG